MNSPCGEMLVRSVRPEYDAKVTDELYSTRMKIIYNLLRRLIPESRWDEVFYFGLSLLEKLDRYVGKRNNFEFIMFVEDLDEIDEIFDLDPSATDQPNLWPSCEYELFDDDELDRKFVLKLLPFYNCAIWSDYSEWKYDLPNFEIDLLVTTVKYYDFIKIHLVHDHRVLEFVFRDTRDSIVLIIMESNKYVKADPRDLLASVVKNVFLFDYMETFVCLNDLLNYTPVSRLPVYSTECCSQQMRMYASVNERTGLLELYATYRSLAKLYNDIWNRYVNVYQYLYLLNDVRGYEFASLTKRSSCRSQVLREKYFYRWLRFAWRASASGRCGRRMRRAVDKWRRYLYAPRFGSARVQNEWKRRFERHCKKLL